MQHSATFRLSSQPGRRAVEQLYEHAFNKWQTQHDDWIQQNSCVEGRQAAGWELVSAVVYQAPERNYSNTVLWFKRPVYGNKASEHRSGGGVIM